MNWAVHIFDARSWFVGVVFVRTRANGRRLCHALSDVGCSGFVTRPDGWRSVSLSSAATPTRGKT